MFGFGKKNKKRKEKEKQELEFITMESALNNVSPEEIFDKSAAKKREQPPKKKEDDFELPKKQISSQIREQIKDQVKETKKKGKEKEKTDEKEKERLARIEKRLAQIEKKDAGASKLDSFQEDTINTRDIKARKVEVPLEQTQKSQGMMIDKILKKKDEMTIKKQMEKAEEQLPLGADLMPEGNKNDAVQTLDIKRGKEMEDLERSIKSQAKEKEKKSKVKPIIKRLLEEIPKPPKEEAPKKRSAHKKTASPFGIEQKPERKEESSGSGHVSVPSRIQPQTQFDQSQQKTREQEAETEKTQPVPQQEKVSTQIKPKKGTLPVQEKESVEAQKKEQYPSDSPFFAETESGKQQDSSLSSELGKREGSSKQPKQKVQQSIPEEETRSRTFGRKIQTESETNKPLLYFAVLVLLLTVFSGVYYYLFVIKKSQTGWTPIDLPLALDSKPEDNSSSQTQSAKNDLKKELSRASKRSLNQNNFQEELKQLLTALKSDPAMETVLENGIYVKFVSESNIPYTSKQILSFLEIESESLQSVSVDNVWAFLVLEERNTLNNKLKTVKFNLLFELTQEKQNSQIVATIIDEEEELPRQLVPLFIDEEKPSIPIFVKFERSFTQSEAAPQTRYFNYEEGSGNKSIDWGVVTSEDTDYLLISTSKNSTQQFVKSLQ